MNMNEACSIQNMTMASQLKATTEALTFLVGEPCLARQLAANAHELMVLDAIQCIEDSTTAGPVWKELGKHTDSEHVCELAIERLRILVLNYFFGRPNRRHAVEDTFPPNSVGIILDAMANNKANESIQYIGVYLLGVLADFQDNLALLSSKRCIEIMMSAMELFPDSSIIQEVTLYSIHVIQMACVFEGLYSSYYSNLIAANALKLCLIAIERHPDDAITVYNALILFGKAETVSQHDRKVVRDFGQAHDCIIRAVFKHAWETLLDKSTVTLTPIVMAVREAFNSLGLTLPRGWR
jgi:hypothetical protein